MGINLLSARYPILATTHGSNTPLRQLRERHTTYIQHTFNIHSTYIQHAFNTHSTQGISVGKPYVFLTKAAKLPAVTRYCLFIINNDLVASAFSAFVRKTQGFPTEMPCVECVLNAC